MVETNKQTNTQTNKQTGGNWAQMESLARDLAIERGLDLVVYTGTFYTLLLLGFFYTYILGKSFVLRYAWCAATAPSEWGLG